MATTCGLSQSTVSRIWRAFGVQPHWIETFKLSQDPLFIEKVRDVVGPYLNPPDKALVLCVDEKAQIQAWDRARPLLPMRPGQVERRTHNDRRHGTTALFAALNVKTYWRTGFRLGSGASSACARSWACAANKCSGSRRTYPSPPPRSRRVAPASAPRSSRPGSPASDLRQYAPRSPRLSRRPASNTCALWPPPSHRLRFAAPSLELCAAALA